MASYKHLSRFPEQEQHRCPSPPSSQTGRPKKGKIHKTRRELWLAMLTVSLSMLALGSLLLGLVLRYRIAQTDPWFASVEYADARSDTEAFYLDMSATRFVTVASWISNIATLLSGAMMLLFTSNVAQKLLQASESNLLAQCPTPWQLSLFLQAKGGSLTVLWEVIKYACWKRRARMGYMVVGPTISLMTISVLSYTIWGLDTWLHVSTEATSITRGVSNHSTYHQYGRAISCDPSDETRGGCSTNRNGLAEVAEAFQTLNNMSATNMVSTYENNSRTFAFVTDANLERGRSFQASSLAITTECVPISTTNGCQTLISQDETGDLVQFGVSCQGFDAQTAARMSDQGINNTLLFLDQGDLATAVQIDQPHTNPFSLAVTVVSGTWASGLAADDRSMILYTNATWFVGWSLVCTSTVYDIEYRWTNGSFSGILSANLSNDIVANTFSTPFLTGIGKSIVSNAVATALGEPTMDRVAQTYSLVFAKTAMAMGASVGKQVSNMEEAETVLGARVPRRPLIGLLSVVLLYAGLALTSGGTAIWRRSAEIDNVQARLSVTALTAACFEYEASKRPVQDMEDLFMERSYGDGSVRLQVVAIDRKQGQGWQIVRTDKLGGATSSLGSP